MGSSLDHKRGLIPEQEMIDVEKQILQTRNITDSVLLHRRQSN